MAVFLDSTNEDAQDLYAGASLVIAEDFGTAYALCGLLINLEPDGNWAEGYHEIEITIQVRNPPMGTYRIAAKGVWIVKINAADVDQSIEQLFGPYLFSLGDEVTITLKSDNAADTVVDVLIDRFTDEADYLLSNSPAPGGAVADSYGQRIKAVDDLTQSEGDGDLAALPAAVADAVLDELTAGHETPGSLCAAIVAILTKANLIGTSSVTYSTASAVSGHLDLYAGSDYLDADSRAVTAVVSSYGGPSLTAATLKLRLLRTTEWEHDTEAADLEVTGALTIDGTTVTCKADLTDTQTAALSTYPPDKSKNYRWQFVATTATDTALILAAGTATVHKGIEASS